MARKALCCWTKAGKSSESVEKLPHSGRTQTYVIAITVSWSIFGETSIVNMVRGTSKKALLEPGDTRQQWKGEAAARLVECRDHQ